MHRLHRLAVKQRRPADLSWSTETDAPLQLLRRARTDYLAHKFDDVSLAGSSKKQRAQSYRTPGAGRPLDYPELEGAIESWVVGLREKHFRVTRIMVLRRVISLEPSFMGYSDIAKTPAEVANWLPRAYGWVNRWQRRTGFTMHNVHSTGQPAEA